MKKSPRLFLLVIIVGSLFVSCTKGDNNNHVEYVDRQIYEMMKDVYLWYQYLPANVNPGDYTDPAKYIAALRYPAYDKWSTAMTYTEFNQYFQEGQMIGHGFMLGLDNAGNVRVCFLYRNTEAANKGVKRGWIISKINGTPVNSSNVFNLLGAAETGLKNNITFINLNGETVDLSLTKSLIELTPVLHFEIINQADKKIGYMVFQDFITTANQELDEVFDSLTSAGIDEMVIDLRYNGGGSVDVAEHLAGWLLGKNYGNETFLYYEHNDKLTSLDTSYNVPVRANGLSLGRIFFIGTQNTASASELIINGVRPFIGSVLAGSATHGKPVGMYAIPVSDYVALPVCFKYSNKNHEGDFYTGIQPQLPAADDLTRDFGDPQEASLKAVLDFIQSGTIASLSAKSTEGFRSQVFEPQGAIGQYLKAF